jgi:hypothetical protein
MCGHMINHYSSSGPLPLSPSAAKQISAVGIIHMDQITPTDERIVLDFI